MGLTHGGPQEEEEEMPDVPRPVGKAVYEDTVTTPEDEARGHKEHVGHRTAGVRPFASTDERNG